IKGRIAQIEQTGVADHDVEPDGQKYPHAGVGGLVDPGPAAASGQKRDEGGKGNGAQEEQSIDNQVAVGPAARQVRQPGLSARRAHFSGTRMPSSPVGRKTRTRIRMLKIQTSVSWEVK